MKRKSFFIFFLLFFSLVWCEVKKTKLYEKNINGKGKTESMPKATQSTRGENLTEQEFEEYTKLVEEGCTDEEIVYKLGYYHLILQNTWYSDKAEYYLKIGAAQDSPRCLFLLVNLCLLRDDDMTDVESYDRLKELAEKDYQDAKMYFNKIQDFDVKRIALKKQGIYIHIYDE